MLRPRSLRLRIAAAFVLGSILVTGVVGVVTYVLISQRLTEARRTTVLNQTFQGVAAARELVRRPQGATVSEVVTRLQRRNDVIVRQRNEWQSSSHVLDQEVIDDRLRQSVRNSRPAIATIDDPRRLIVGSLVPDTSTEVYFVFSLAAVDRTLALVSRIFLVVSGLAAVIAGVAGYRLAGRTIRPLRLAAEAARQVAGGDLHARLDVTGEDELAQLSDAFNRMTVALEARIERERQFVADVSHELRTPLTALKSSIDFLASRTEDIPEKLRRPLGMAAEEVRSLQRLVDDLLELSRMEAGGQVAQSEDVDLVDFAAQLARRRAPSADVRIHGPEALVVWTDKRRLERVVGNLLENAVFHGGDGGVDITLEGSNGIARIVVTDHGPGIDPEKLPWIFERFYRGDASRRRDGRVGSGLGLAIARENAALIGADIEVESTHGHGTRFEVRVPEGYRS